ncbi:nuclear transport factor 2 family protein [Streptomyces sp. NPDC004134]|uniref:nuclear transport factor 2 family protein n=1 Tax=Streptomyces sp. NPDC004134 TaxID=3364691 RepID=UPI0036BFC540
MSARTLDPAVAVFVAAVNAGDRGAFFAVLTDDATMSDDGTDYGLVPWTEREIFSAEGRMDIETVSPDGRSLLATYTNTTWGTMHTRWTFTITDGKISHFETGQA